MNEHSQITRKPFSGAVLFNTADEMLSAMFGPAQHDAHVARRREHIRLAARKESDDRAFDALMDYVRAKIAKERAAR